MPKPFVPEKLPLENINWENLLANIVKANSAVAKFDGLLESILNPLLFLNPLMIQEAVLSSKIEGIDHRRVGIFSENIRDGFRFDPIEVELVSDKVGTDCNRCMMACPWSHARTFPHRLIVFLITRNKLAGKIFSYMDDLFYGRQPKPKKGPDWASYK